MNVAVQNCVGKITDRYLSAFVCCCFFGGINRLQDQQYARYTFI